jgi:hypothetical protein
MRAWSVRYVGSIKAAGAELVALTAMGTSREAGMDGCTTGADQATSERADAECFRAQRERRNRPRTSLTEY